MRWPREQLLLARHVLDDAVVAADLPEEERCKDDPRRPWR